MSSPRTPATVEPIKSYKQAKRKLMSEARKAIGKLQERKATVQDNKLAVARGSK